MAAKLIRENEEIEILSKENVKLAESAEGAWRQLSAKIS